MDAELPGFGSNRGMRPLIGPASLDHDDSVSTGRRPIATTRVLSPVFPPAPERPAKSALRARMVACRDQISAERRVAAAEAVADLGGALLSDLPRGSVVGLYAAKGAELDLRPLHEAIRRAGHLVAYPRVVPGQARLELAVAEPGELVPALFGLREPSPRAGRVDLAALVALFIPGLAFDEQGTRLGWGKGYYDATLPYAINARRVGVGFECQVVERVPRAAHDVPMQVILTEAKVRQIGD